MAKQTGIIPLSGTIDNITFCNDKKNGGIARKKTSLDKKRIATDPAFERTRENNGTFSHIAKSRALLINAFSPVARKASDSFTSDDLHSLMAAVIKTDKLSARGEQKLSLSNLSLLEEFNWSREAQLSDVMPACSVEVLGGQVAIHIPPLNPSNDIKAPAGATYFEITAARATLDFDAKQKETASATSEKMPLTASDVPDLTLSLPLSESLTAPAFIGLGITFYYKLGQVLFPVKQGNAFAIVKVIR